MGTRGRGVAPSAAPLVAPAPSVQRASWLQATLATSALDTSTILPTVAWLARCAVARPAQTVRVAKRVTPSLYTAVQQQQQQQQQQQEQQQQEQQEVDATVSQEGAVAWMAESPIQMVSRPLATTVEELRAQHGHRQRWWGDLSPADGRRLYHSLLPTSLLDDERSAALPLGARAKLAVAARRAARLYVRERTVLPAALSCELLDGARTLLRHGTFQSGGLSEAQVWDKYAEEAGIDPEELERSSSSFTPGEKHAEVFYTVLHKACSSNKNVDQLVGCAEACAEGVCDIIGSL